MENNWEEVNNFFIFYLLLIAEVIEDKFEYYGCYEKWKILEVCLRDNKKIGINIILFLKNIIEIKEIMKVIIIVGIFIVLWSVNGKDIFEKLRRNFF